VQQSRLETAARRAGATAPRQSTNTHEDFRDGATERNLQSPADRAPARRTHPVTPDRRPPLSPAAITDPAAMDYTLKPASLDALSFLRHVRPLLDDASVEVFSPAGQKAIKRLEQDGLVTLIGRVGGRPVGIAASDFRVNGGSVGAEIAARLGAFTRHLAAIDAPLILSIDMFGVRVMEGRQVFGAAFGLLPTLMEFAERQLLITCTAGRALGIGAILYAMGHYRLAAGERTALSLTGPEVFKLFFGEKVDFEELASARRAFRYNEAVHELAPSSEAMWQRVRALIAPDAVQFAAPADAPADAGGPRLARVLDALGEARLEVMHQIKCSVRAYLVRRGDQLLGVVANPIGEADNLINVKALKKYEAALAFFRALRVPVVSVLDTPGIDPRIDESDRNLLRQIVATCQAIAAYPHGKMGVVAGRCYGGASTLGFPKFLGSDVVVALEGAHAGIMHSSIIDRLLGGSPRLMEQWRAVHATETEDLADLQRQGMIDRVCSVEDLGRDVERFLAARRAQLLAARLSAPPMPSAAASVPSLIHTPPPAPSTPLAAAASAAAALAARTVLPAWPAATVDADLLGFQQRASSHAAASGRKA
jgi:propionyl-CoA carboxylase beta chain